MNLSKKPMNRIFDVNKTTFYNKFGKNYPWKGLGHELTEGETIEQHQIESELNYTVNRAPVEYWHDGELKTFENRFVNFRSDTGHPFETVSDRYKIVQPKTAIEIFHTISDKIGMKLKVAGSINNGSRYFALAKISSKTSLDIAINDKIQAYALLGGSVDGSSSTLFKILTIREICANTMTVIEAINTLKVHHSSKFVLKDMRDKIELINEKLEKHTEKSKKIASINITDGQAVKFFLDLVKTDKEKKEGLTDIDTLASKKRSINKIWTSYKDAPGAQNTLWGAVQAVTHSVDYNPSAQSPDSRLSSAWYGVGDTLKTKAFKTAIDDNLIDSIVDTTKNSGNVGLNNLLDMIRVMWQG